MGNVDYRCEGLSSGLQYPWSVASECGSTFVTSALGKQRPVSPGLTSQTVWPGWWASSGFRLSGTDWGRLSQKYSGERWRRHLTSVSDLPSCDTQASQHSHPCTHKCVTLMIPFCLQQIYQQTEHTHIHRINKINFVMYHVIWTDDIMLYKKTYKSRRSCFFLVILTVYVCLLYMDVGKHIGLVCMPSTWLLLFVSDVLRDPVTLGWDHCCLTTSLLSPSVELCAVRGGM